MHLFTSPLKEVLYQKATLKVIKVWKNPQEIIQLKILNSVGEVSLVQANF